MSELLKTITEVAIAEVHVSRRLRPVSEAGVESLLASIAELGVMKDGIDIRKVPHRDGRLELMAGGHRLEAARRLGWTMIPAKVWKGSDDWARLVEIDDNLASAELTALDSAVFLAERKRVYEKLHPETRADAFKGNRHTGKLANDIVSFATSTAEKFGLSKRQIERIVAAGTCLGQADVDQLRGAPRPVSLKDLLVLAKIGEPDERSDVIGRLAEGRARSAAEARSGYATETGAAPPPKDQVEQAFKALREHWIRAPKAARRRFVETHARELADLLPEAPTE